MKVFLSWSGDHSKAYANALRDWLPLIVHFAEPWVSDADIEAGERWASEVAKELETSNFGIICITRENVGSQWLLFEAGALSRSMQEGRVIPLLFDIDFKDISGPLAQFQAKKFDAKGVWDAVCAINRLGEAPIPDGRLKQLFDALWKDLDAAVEKIPNITSSAKALRPQQEVLEELVSSVRGLDARLRDMNNDGPNNRVRSASRTRAIQRDFMHMIDMEPGNPLRLLVLTSTLRDDMPWLYELANEIYRQESSGNKERSLRTKRQLMQAIQILPSRMFDDKQAYELMRELEYWISHEDIPDRHRRNRPDTDTDKAASSPDPTNNT